jgi:hypothetical protein
MINWKVTALAVSVGFVGAIAVAHSAGWLTVFGVLLMMFGDNISKDRF